MAIRVKIINQSAHPLPQYATPGSAGMDLRANLEEPLVLEPMKRAAVPTGLYLEIPQGFEAQIRPRSGLAMKHGITCLNTPGTIDSDYRGEIRILLINLSEENQIIEPGDRIAQMIFQRVEQADLEEVATLETSGRSAGGFGSTGKN